MMIDINKNKGFAAVLAGTVVVLVVLLLLWRSASKGTQAQADKCRNIISRYQAITRQHQGEPGKALMALYAQKEKEAMDAADKMRTAVTEDAVPAFKPSEFKERVRKTVDEMVPAFKAKTIPVPEDLGFGQIYLGRDLPKEAEIPKLTSQYLVIGDVASVLLENQVIKVEAIDRLVEDKGSGGIVEPAPPGTEDEKKPKEVFESVPVRFKFATTPGGLYDVLAGIRNKNRLYRIRQLKSTMEPLAKGEGKDPSDIREELAVELTVERIVLLREEPK